MPRGLTELGAVLNERGRAVEAEPLLREALAAPSRNPRSTYNVAAAARRELGYSLALQGRYPEAEPLLLEAYRELSDVSGYRSRKEKQQALRLLVRLYQRMGKPAEAAKYERLLAVGPRSAVAADR